MKFTGGTDERAGAGLISAVDIITLIKAISVKH